MLGFEPRISGFGSDRSTNWATTTALTPIKIESEQFLSYLMFVLYRFWDGHTSKYQAIPMFANLKCSNGNRFIHRGTAGGLWLWLNNASHNWLLRWLSELQKSGYESLDLLGQPLISWHWECTWSTTVISLAHCHALELLLIDNSCIKLDRHCYLYWDTASPIMIRWSELPDDGKSSTADYR